MKRFSTTAAKDRYNFSPDREGRDGWLSSLNIVLAPRQYLSGETDRNGSISKRGNCEGIGEGDEPGGSATARG